MRLFHSRHLTGLSRRFFHTYPGLCLTLCVALALAGTCRAETPATLTVRDTVRLSALGTMVIELHGADVEAKRLTLTIRGPEVTSLPRQASIMFHFDAPVTRALILATSPALYGVAASAGSHVTCDVRRDPFSPPVPWQVTLQIELEALPHSGRIVLWNRAEQHVTYQLTPPVLSKPTL